MIKRSQLFLFFPAMSILLASVPTFGADITLTLLPISGSVAGNPSSTVGWGYTLINNTTNWIQTESVSSSAFLYGTPNEIFDFPDLAPNSSVTLGFSATATASCGSPPCGIYELIWDSTAPVGFTNSGTFTVSSEFFSADPNTPIATDLGPAPDASAAYSATVGSATIVPESSSVLLVLSGFGILLTRLRSIQSRYGHGRKL
jgi:hypothetical protein